MYAVYIDSKQALEEQLDTLIKTKKESSKTEKRKPVKKLNEEDFEYTPIKQKRKTDIVNKDSSPHPKV